MGHDRDDRNGSGPAAVGVDELPGPKRQRALGRDLEQCHLMGRAGTAALGDQTTPLAAVEVHFGHIHLRPDDPAPEREAGVVLEGLPKRPELLVLAVGVDDDLGGKLVDSVAHRSDPTGRQFHRFDPLAPVRQVGKLLAAIDEDRSGILWG